MLDRQEAETLFLAHLGLIERMAASHCRRHGISGADAEDMDAWAKMKLVEGEYASLRKFRGESSFSTFLTAVVAMLFRDYRVRETGRWRPSAAAVRLGLVAERLEALVYRQHMPLAQASELLRSQGLTLQSDRELALLFAQLPNRLPMRPVTGGGPEELDRMLGDTSADDRLLAEEAARERRETFAALSRALSRLPDEDNVIVRMRVCNGSSVADIARALCLEQKPLYRRLERLLKEMRRELEAAGITLEKVNSLLGKEDE